MDIRYETIERGNHWFVCEFFLKSAEVYTWKKLAWVVVKSEDVGHEDKVFIVY